MGDAGVRVGASLAFGDPRSTLAFVGVIVLAVAIGVERDVSLVAQGFLLHCSLVGCPDLGGRTELVTVGAD